MSNSNLSFPTDHYQVIQDAPADYEFHHQLGPTIITTPEPPSIIMLSQDFNSMEALYPYSDSHQLMPATFPSIPHPNYQMIMFDSFVSQCTNGSVINNMFPPFWQELPVQYHQEQSSMTTKAPNYENLIPSKAPPALSSTSISPTVFVQPSLPAKKAKSSTLRRTLTKSNASPRGEYHCDLCNKSFNKRLYLKQHNKYYHNGVQPFKCQMCGKRFANGESYENHAAKHSSIKPFKCETCPKAFHHKIDLRRHMYLHSDSKPFPCDLCGKGFIRKDHMLNHVNTHERRKFRQKKKLSEALAISMPDSNNSSSM